MRASPRSAAKHATEATARLDSADMALLRLRSVLRSNAFVGPLAFSSAPALADIPDSWRNPAAVLHGIDDIRFEDMPLPDRVADGHVRVQMRAVGICGSDVHYYKKVSHTQLRRRQGCHSRSQTLQNSRRMLDDGKIL